MQDAVECAVEDRLPSWLSLREGFEGKGPVNSIWFQIFQCKDAVLRAAWRELGVGGQPKGPYITRLRALSIMGKGSLNNWKRTMSFDMRHINGDGWGSNVRADRCTWEELEELELVPDVTIMVKSVLDKVNAA